MVKRPTTTMIAAALSCTVLTACSGGEPISGNGGASNEQTPRKAPQEASQAAQDSLTLEQQGLVDRLPSDVTDCQPPSGEVAEGAVATVDCLVSGFAVTYTAFANSGDMRAYYDSIESDLTIGSCDEAWNQEGIWEEGAARGRVKCYDDAEGPVIEWMHNTKYIHGSLFGTPGDRDALREAWTRAGP